MSVREPLTTVSIVSLKLFTCNHKIVLVIKLLSCIIKRNKLIYYTSLFVNSFSNYDPISSFNYAERGGRLSNYNLMYVHICYITHSS